MTAKELAEICLDLAKGLYERKGPGYVHPACLHISAPADHKVMFFEDFGDEESKGVLRMVCEAAASADAELLAFCSEGWMLRVPAGKDPVEERHKVMNDLSLHPERIEMLVIEVIGPRGAWSLASRIDRRGEHVRLEEYSSEKPGPGWHNRFLSNLPWKEIPTT